MTGRLRRILSKPPRYIAERALDEARRRFERIRSPSRTAALTPEYLAASQGFASVDSWWEGLGARPYPAYFAPITADYDLICPGDRDRIIAAAERACEHRVDLLGSGDVFLGDRISWHRDYKSGYGWPRGYFSTLRYGRPEQASDVKFPWELSRLQWLIPAGQAYVLTGDERYARAAKAVLESWIEENPYGDSINWSCTMEVALRIISMTWLFHAFRKSPEWRSNQFRGAFLRTVYLHADFASRHLEKSDVNGNHYTADAAGLVYAGLFFTDGDVAQRWLQLGWGILVDELPRQVFADGVDFEASIPYHRLVQELFAYPALYRQKCGLDIPGSYRQRLLAMAGFTAAYSRADGTVPLVGDADDARTLPFGGQDINDHRYLIGLAGLAFRDEELLRCASGPRTEVYWLLGSDAARALPAEPACSDASRAFPDGGCYVLRNAVDHVFVSCGPLGLAGRGGHSHNDTLSFEAVLDGVHLISDCGAYLYTANFAERNAFRSTAYHNTPRIDGEEINRLISPEFLWGLREDARPDVREISLDRVRDRLIVSHTGYQRLPHPVTPVRTLTLSHAEHSLRVTDEFEASGEHAIEIPLHLAHGVALTRLSNGTLLLTKGDRSFRVTWGATADWVVDVENARISLSYGTFVPSSVLRWRRCGPVRPLRIEITPV